MKPNIVPTFTKYGSREPTRIQKEKRRFKNPISSQQSAWLRSYAKRCWCARNAGQDDTATAATANPPPALQCKTPDAMGAASMPNTNDTRHRSCLVEAVPNRAFQHHPQRYQDEIVAPGSTQDGKKANKVGTSKPRSQLESLGPSLNTISTFLLRWKRRLCPIRMP